MKKIKRKGIFAIGVLLIIGSIGGLQEGDIAMALIAIVTGAILIKLSFKEKKNKSPKHEKNTNRPLTNEKVRSNKNIYKTYVAGIMMNDNDGNDIQKKLKTYIKENHDFDNFEDCTNKEILENDDEVWQYDLTEFDTVELVPEPTNPYDPNAIMVIHEEMNHIGYIPAKETEKVYKILSSEALLTYRLDYKGGTKKYVDYDDDKDDYVVKKDTKPWYIDLEILSE